MEPSQHHAIWLQCFNVHYLHDLRIQAEKLTGYGFGINAESLQVNIPTIQVILECHRKKIYLTKNMHMFKKKKTIINQDQKTRNRKIRAPGIRANKTTRKKGISILTSLMIKRRNQKSKERRVFSQPSVSQIHHPWIPRADYTTPFYLRDLCIDGF